MVSIREIKFTICAMLFVFVIMTPLGWAFQLRSFFRLGQELEDKGLGANWDLGYILKFRWTDDEEQSGEDDLGFQTIPTTAEASLTANEI